MKWEVKNWIIDKCSKLGLNANYIGDNDIWFIHRQGRAITAFTTWQFYSIPRRARQDQLLPLLKVGLNNNLGEKYKDQVFLYLRFGKKII